MDEVEGIVDPVLVQAECAGALARRTDNTDRALRFAAGLRDLPGMQMQRMTAGLVRKACRIAAHHRIRGADAIYVATAVEEGAILVTWDLEMLNRGAAVVETQTPEQWLDARSAD